MITLLINMLIGGTEMKKVTMVIIDALRFLGNLKSPSIEYSQILYLCFNDVYRNGNKMDIRSIYTYRWGIINIT